MAVINGKQRFATEGIRFQRLNPDGTIPAPERFLGFANNVDLTKVLEEGSATADLTIKVDYLPPVTRQVDFSDASNLTRVTVQEAIEALTAAGFPDVIWSQDLSTTRLRGSYSDGVPAGFAIELTNNSAGSLTVPAGTYSLFYGGKNYTGVREAGGLVPANGTFVLDCIATKAGDYLIPREGDSIDLTSLNPHLPGNLESWSGEAIAVTSGVNPQIQAKIIQVLGPLAAALDFGQGIQHSGNGLEVISFFDDETISIGLPKDIKDKEEIDIEGAKGTITRMVIGAMLQGLSPVVTLKEKNYYFLEMVQGGRLDRATGIYNPPLSMESDHPGFWAEVFSAIYGRGSNVIGGMAGYERLLIRNMIGHEGDVPIEAKSWAQYAYNLTAIEYTDPDGNSWPAWEEQSISTEQFDALRVRQVSVRN